MLTNKNQYQRNPQNKTYKLVPETPDICLQHPRRPPIPRSETQNKMTILILQQKYILKIAYISFTLESGPTSLKCKIIFEICFMSP